MRGVIPTPRGAVASVPPAHAAPLPELGRAWAAEVVGTYRSTLVLTRSEHWVMAAHRRHLQRWAVMGGVAAPIVYAWVAGWPPAHPLPFGVGLALVVLGLVALPLTESRTPRSRKMGRAGGVPPRTVLLRVLSVAVWALIAATLLMQRGTPTVGGLKAVLVLMCADPIKRYAGHVALHRIRAAVEEKGGTVQVLS
jgi:hypothetical protein